MFVPWLPGLPIPGLLSRLLANRVSPGPESSSPPAAASQTGTEIETLTGTEIGTGTAASAAMTVVAEVAVEHLLPCFLGWTIHRGACCSGSRRAEVAVAVAFVAAFPVPILEAAAAVLFRQKAVAVRQPSACLLGSATARGVYRSVAELGSLIDIDRKSVV